MKIRSIPKSEFAGTIQSYNLYLNAEETGIVVALANSVAPKVFIEFGCNRGHTAKALLEHVASLERYIGIDVPFVHQPTQVRRYRQRNVRVANRRRSTITSALISSAII